MRKAVYAGSFDPITNGHMDILRRALDIFDEVILLLAVNPAKKGIFSVEERLEMMKDAIADMERVKVDFYDGLTVDYCKKNGAKHLIRGLRAVSDFEYEFQLCEANHFLDKEVEMVFLMSHSSTAFISSSMINQLRKSGADIAALVPIAVVEAYKRKGL